MIVKSAYPQAKGFMRDVYVRPLCKENDGSGFWKLHVPAYSHTDSGCLWYLTSHEAFTTRYDFVQTKHELFLYVSKKKKIMLMLVVQVNDFLYGGTPNLAWDFEKFLHPQFKIGSTEHTFVMIKGAHLTR